MDIRLYTILLALLVRFNANARMRTNRGLVTLVHL